MKNSKTLITILIAIIFLLIMTSCNGANSPFPTETSVPPIGRKVSPTETRSYTITPSFTTTLSSTVTLSPYPTVSYPLKPGPVITRENAGQVVLLGTIKEKFSNSPFLVSQLAWSPDSRQLAVATNGDGVRIIDPLAMREVGEIRQNVEGLIDQPSSVAYSPEGATLAVAIPIGDFSIPGDITFYDAKDYKTARGSIVARNTIGIRYSHNGDWLAVGTVHSIYVVNLKKPDSKFLMDFGSENGNFYFARFSMDDRYFAFTGMDYSAQIYDTSTWSLLYEFDSWSGGFCFSLDGKYIAIKSGLWSLEKRNMVSDFEPNYSITSCDYGTNGDIIIAAGNDRSNISIIDAETGKILFSFAESQDIYGLVVSPDGRLIASVAWPTDNTIKIWGIPG